MSSGASSIAKRGAQRCRLSHGRQTCARGRGNIPFWWRFWHGTLRGGSVVGVNGWLPFLPAPTQNCVFWGEMVNGRVLHIQSTGYWRWRRAFGVGFGAAGKEGLAVLRRAKYSSTQSARQSVLYTIHIYQIKSSLLALYSCSPTSTPFVVVRHRWASLFSLTTSPNDCPCRSGATSPTTLLARVGPLRSSAYAHSPASYRYKHCTSKREPLFLGSSPDSRVSILTRPARGPFISCRR